MQISKITIISILAVLSVVVVYGIPILALTWPINELSISKAGSLGDSFGLLTSFFSGLAFAGVLLTLYLQGKELSLQRQEMAKSSSAQEKTVRLMALTALLEHHKSTAKKIQDSIDNGSINNSHYHLLVSKRDSSNEKAESLASEIEGLLRENT